ncbi:MAG TPA: response regulator [Desulfobulbus sp.]|nr:response regulator [Desulfobulbus sp.]
MNIQQKDKATLVIVDDEQTILTELEILLCRSYEVHTFLNPEDVEEFVDTHHVDLIVCDEMMPEMRGSELLERLHRKHPDICKIVLSGQAEKNDIVKAINEGHIYSFLFKPVNREQLLNVIENGLENRMMKLLLEEQNRQLKDLNENLEEKVRERTAQLVKAYKRLEQLDDNKMAFLIYLSNEISSPLDRLKKLAEVLITYFGLAGSDLSPSLQPVEAGKLVQKILADRQETVDEKELHVDNRVPEDLVMQADPDYLEFLLATLIDNGLVFCNRGGTVTIDSRRDGDRVSIMVSDTGRGFAPDDRDLLFRPFVLPPEKRNPDGFGLNLPQARIIIDAHDGELSAESPGPGRGATFTLTLRG